MRCLECGQDNLPEATEVCPHCGVYLPHLLRDVLPPRESLNAGKYQIEYAIGRGGFGITYRALHVDLKQRVAIKEFFPREQAARHARTRSLTVAAAARPAFEKALARFLEEGRLLARLNQSNVVQVRDFFKERETAYLVMEYLSGQTLRSELEAAPGRKLTEKRVQEVVSALVGALSASHDAGIYHLDLKPENVMVETSGRIVLIDFGASRQGLGTRTTRAFTPDYAPLELMSSGMAVGPQSDLFELGMLLHEMLTGKLPPDALSRALKDDWAPAGVEEPYAGMISEALKLKPSERPSNVAKWWKTSARKRARRPDTESQPASQVDAEVQLNLRREEAQSGCKKWVKVDGRTLKIQIPAGVTDGAVLRIDGALPGVGGGPGGNLLVRIKVAPQPDVSNGLPWIWNNPGDARQPAVPAGTHAPTAPPLPTSDNGPAPAYGAGGPLTAAGGVFPYSSPPFPARPPEPLIVLSPRVKRMLLALGAALVIGAAAGFGVIGLMNKYADFEANVRAQQVKARISQAETAYNSGDYADAAKRFEQALNSNEESVVDRARIQTELGYALVRLALAAYAARDTANARSDYERALSYSPNYNIAHVEFAVLLERIGDHAGAQEQKRLVVAGNDFLLPQRLGTGSGFTKDPNQFVEDRREQALQLILKGDQLELKGDHDNAKAMWIEAVSKGAGYSERDEARTRLNQTKY